MPNFVQTVTANPIVSTVGAPVVIATLDAEPLPAGSYSFQWLCEIRLQSLVVDAFAQADLFFMGASVYQDSWNSDQWHVFSGAGGAPFNSGDTPQFQMILSRQGNAATAEIRKVRLTLLQEST